MPRSVTQYDLLISCPGDIHSELPLINKAVEEFNSLFSDTLGISIRTKHWSKNAYAQSGGKPQALLNGQFVKDCDAAVALFWTRFGTPTDEYGSGTEEEIEIMLGSGKQVFMYFSDKPISPSRHNIVEYSKVQAFRDKYKGRGLFFTYTTDEEFYKLFFAHLTQHFIAEKRVAEVGAERVSKLSLRGIDREGKLSEIAEFQPVKLNTDRSFKSEVEEIKRLIGFISDIHVQALPSSMSSLYQSLNPPVEVPAGWIDVISAVADSMELSLSEDFFCLGDLTRDVLSAPLMSGGPQYNGAKEEKRKYSLIYQLYHKINEAFNWRDVEDSFKSVMCVRLALTNTGTTADDEIDVALRVPTSQLLLLDELPQLKAKTLRYLTRDCDLKGLLSIHSTAEYDDFDSANQSQPQVFIPRNTPVFPSAVDYAKDYREEMEDIFCYEVYSDGDDFVVKLRFDHLNHHKNVAFPSPFLLKGKPGEILYTITSRNSTDVLSGRIAVK